MRSVTLNDLLETARHIKIVIPTEPKLLEYFNLELIEKVYKEAQKRIFYQEVDEIKKAGTYEEKPFPKDWIDLNKLSFEEKILSLDAFEVDLDILKATALYVPFKLLSYFRLSRRFNPVIGWIPCTLTKAGSILSADIFISPDENIYIETPGEFIALVHQ